MRKTRKKIRAVILAFFLLLQSASVTAYAENYAGEETDIVISAGTFDAQDPSGTDDDLFPGLPQGYEMSPEQLEQKSVLSEHMSEAVSEDTGINEELYAEGEVVYLTDSAEDAQIVADAFGGTLDSYSYAVAVISLPEEATVEQAMIAAADEDILLPAIWPNYYKTLYTTDYIDPALNEGADDYQWMHAVVGDTYAWEAGYKGAGIKVGILDTGILNSHEEFTGRLVQHLDMTEETAAAATTDVQGHGTHVAGIVAANLGNGKGGAGIAPEASLYMYRVADSKGSIDAASEYRAINRAATTDGVDVINMSFGSGQYDGNEAQVIENAYNAGVAIFAAAGNESTNGKSYPASYEHVCSIAASQQDGSKTYFSNHNTSVDLIFPGLNIYSTAYSSGTAYTYKSGTSMACPVASGVAAVILSGAENVPALNGKTGAARVDALYRVMADNAVKSSSADTGAGATYLPRVFGITVNDPDAVPQTPVFSLADRSVISAETTELRITSATPGMSIYYSTNGTVPAWKDGRIYNGIPYTGPITVGGAKTVTVKAIAVNLHAGIASKVSTAMYRFAPAPSGLAVNAAGAVNKLVPGTGLSLSATVTPSYAVTSNITWSVSPANSGVTVSSAGKVSVASAARPGTYTISAQMTAAGKTITGTYPITVGSGSPVKSVAFKSKKITVTIGDTPLDVTSSLTVTHADKTAGTPDDLVFTSSNPEIAAVSATGLITGISPGTVTVTATANDGSNKRASCKVTVIRLADGLTLSGYDKLAPGKSITLTASFLPEDVSVTKLSWSVSGSGVTVKNGKVTASKNAAGSYTVTAAATDGSGVTADYTVTIVSSAIRGISMPKSMTLFTTPGNYNAPTSTTLAPVINGGDPSAILYTSSAPEIATVNATTGRIQAVSRGKAKITCAAADGSNKKAVCTVTVSAPMSRLTIVGPDNNGGYVCVGSKLKLKTQIGTTYGKPASAKINWYVKEGSEDILTVKDGVIKPKKLEKSLTSQTAYVVAEAADGCGATATCSVIVYRKVRKFTVNYYKGGYYVPTATFDNNNVSYNLPYQTTLTAPKGVDVSLQETTYRSLLGGVPAFYPTIAQPTTEKTSAQSRYLTAADGVKIKITVQLEPNGKKASKTMRLYKTSDGVLYIDQ